MPRRRHNEHSFDIDARPLDEKQVRAILTRNGELVWVRQGFYAVVGDESVCVPASVVKSLTEKHQLQRSNRTTDGERYVRDTPAAFKRRSKAASDKKQSEKIRRVNELADGLLASLNKGRDAFNAEVERIADDNFFL